MCNQTCVLKAPLWLQQEEHMGKAGTGMEAIGELTEVRCSAVGAVWTRGRDKREEERELVMEKARGERCGGY